MSRTKIRELFLIQSRERRSVTSLFVLSLLIGVSQISTMTAASALVVSELSPESLPWLVLGSGVGLGGIAALFLRTFRRKTPKRRIVFLSIFLVAGTVLVALYSIWGTRRAGVAVLFYFWSRIENVFLAVVFLIAATDRLSPRSSRRVLGFTTTGQVITLVAGGALIPLVLRRMSPEGLIFASLGAHIATLVHVSRFPRSGSVSPADDSNADADTPLTARVFLLIAAMYLVYFLVDTAFLGGVDTGARPDIDLGVFFARFWFFVGLAALIVKLLVTGRLLHSFGLLTGLLIAPVGLLALFVLAPISESPLGAAVGVSPLVIVIALKAAERVLDGSIFLPSFYGLFQAFRPRVQARNQLLAESLIGQGIASVAGFLLILARQTDRFSLRHIYLLGCAVSVGWIVAAVAAARKYRAVAAHRLAPPSYKRWPTDRPLPPEVGGRNPEGGTALGRRSMSSAGESGDPVVERLLRARALLTMGATYDVRWPPFADAWNHEWSRTIDEVAALIDATMGTARLSDRLVRLQGLEGAQYRTAVDGLAPIIPQRYREPFLALLEKDELFLLDRAMKGYDAEQLPPINHADNPAAVSAWTRSIIALSRDVDRETKWAADHENLRHMKRSQLFSAFSLEYLHQLTRHAERRTFGAGERIVTQDEAGDSLYVVTDGEVSVRSGDHTLARLEAGSCFGELSAILPERRSATVVAEGEVATLVLGRNEVIAFLSRHTSATQTLQVILRDRIAGRLDDIGVPGNVEGRGEADIIPIEMTPEESAVALSGLELFSDLSGGDVADLAVNVGYEDLAPGASVSLRSTADDALRIVVAGAASETVGDLSLGAFGVGSVLGTLPWLGATTHRTSIVASGGCRLAHVSRPVYEALVARSSTFHIAVLSSLVTISRELARVGIRTSES